MADAYFRRLSGDVTSAVYEGTALTAGPWSPQLQHGGPPNALAVATADRAVREATGRGDLVALRFASSFLGPVPVGEFEISSRVLRAARAAACCEVTIAAGDRVCLTTTVWFVREDDTTAQATPVAPAPALPDAQAASEMSPVGFVFGYGTSLEWVFTDGEAGRPGPAAVWARPRHPLVDDAEQLPGLARVALVVDSASGVSAELDWTTWSFVNVDLDVHLSRPFVGERVHMAATTAIGGHGSALAHSVISDEAGVNGHGLQTLVVAPIPTS